MNHDEKSRKVLLTLIAGRNQREVLLAALAEAGMHLVSTMYGRGTIKASVLRDAFGLSTEEKKIIITCVSTEAKVNAALRMLADRFDFDKPNTGIAFTSQIDRVSH